MPAPLAAWAQRRLGPLTHCVDRSWAHAESAVWELRGGRAHAFLKHHRQRRKFQQEVAAYRAWGALPGIPTLLAVRREPPHALLLSALPGRPALQRSLSPERERALQRAAGAWLARLHRVPFPDRDPLPLAPALDARAAAWAARAERVHALGAGGASPDLRAAGAWVRAAVAEASAALRARAEPPARVFCHRDFHERNWLLDDHGAFVGVIDFEHAHADLWLLDLERLWLASWWRRDDLREAFTSGYGRPLRDDDRALLDRLSALYALASLVWARQHHDRAFERDAARLLARARERLRRD